MKSILGSKFVCGFAVLGGIAAVPALANDAVTFSRDVAPILMEHCVGCHRPGEIAPMSLRTFEETRPWAKSIGSKVANREMPPWDADPAFGRFSNAINLTDEQIAKITDWVNEGAPQGDPAEMPALPDFPEEWALGEPDYVIDMGTFDVPAESEDLFITKVVRLDLPEDRWLHAVDVRPGDRRALHHLVGFVGFFEMGEGGVNIADGVEIRPEERNGQSGVNAFSIWAAGTPPTVYPDKMGHELAKDQLISFNIHYHPYGEATRDQSRVGLYFGDGELEKQLTTGFAMNTGIEIAPNTMSREYRASHVFGQDAQIVSFFPHMHQRGRSMTYKLIRPDGSTETLLNVPNYDFNWQWSYVLEKPVDAPKGSRMDVYATWDNTADNPNNPDPGAFIEFGDGTNLEMHIGFFDYIPAVGKAPVAGSPDEISDGLLAQHPAEESYRIRVKAGFGDLSLGMYAPKSGEGVVYVVQGTRVLTMSTDKIRWLSETEVVLDVKAFRDAGRTIPFGVYANVADPANVVGGVFVGQAVPEKPDPAKATIAFTGARVVL